MPQLWCDEVRPLMAELPYVFFTRAISLETMSSASSQEMRSYADFPRFCGLRFPSGSKSTRFIGYLMRSSE